MIDMVLAGTAQLELVEPIGLIRTWGLVLAVGWNAMGLFHVDCVSACGLSPSRLSVWLPSLTGDSGILYAELSSERESRN